MSKATDNLRDAVKEAIERDGAIKSGLARGLINTRALARFIQRSLREQASLEAIISAIRRYPIKPTSSKLENVGTLMTKLSVKNRVVDVAIVNDPSIPSALARFSSQVDYGRGESFRIVAGVERVRVIIDEKNLANLMAVLPKSSVKQTIHNLAEIVVSTTEATLRIPGVLSAMLTELAMNDINLIESMSCTPQNIFVVDERDATRSYDILQRLMRRSQVHGEASQRNTMRT